jgi:hypothetical protein
LFTKITVVSAAVWILLCVLSIRLFNGMAAVADPTAGTNFGSNAPVEPGTGAQPGANTPGGKTNAPRGATGTPAAGSGATGASDAEGAAIGTPAGEGAAGDAASGDAPLEE